jgi:hypothetical protein
MMMPFAQASQPSEGQSQHLDPPIEPGLFWDTTPKDCYVYSRSTVSAVLQNHFGGCYKNANALMD